jgi:acyl carrier protein
MTARNKILEGIYVAIDEVNEQLPEDQNLEKSVETVLLGSSGKLESVNLVNLLVAIEENIEETFDIPISITDERAVSEKNSPFRTVETLCNFMLNLLDEKQNG